MTEWSWHAVHLKSPYRVVVPPEYVSGRLGAVGDDAGEVHGAALLQVHVGPAQDLGVGEGALSRTLWFKLRRNGKSKSMSQGFSID